MMHISRYSLFFFCNFWLYYYNRLIHFFLSRFCNRMAFHFLLECCFFQVNSRYISHTYIHTYIVSSPFKMSKMDSSPNIRTKFVIYHVRPLITAFLAQLTFKLHAHHHQKSDDRTEGGPVCQAFQNSFR